MSRWCEESAKYLVNLVNGPKLSYNEIAKILAKKFNRPFTRCSISGRVNRHRQWGHHMPPNSSYHPTPYKKFEYVPKPPKKSPFYTPVKYILPATEKPYQRKGTCQYIAGYDNVKCGVESQGPWCEEHKKILVQPRNYS